MKFLLSKISHEAVIIFKYIGNCSFLRKVVRKQIHHGTEDIISQAFEEEFSGICLLMAK